MRPDGLPHKRPHFDNWQRSPPVSTEPPKPPEPLTGGVKYKLSDHCTLVMWKGDIVIWHVDGQTDAIVAPANKKVNAGLGINGAIHRAAGPRLADAGAKLPDMAPQGVKCVIGAAVVTRAFNLKVSRVIHAVAPVYQERDDASPRDLNSAYRSALELANREGVKYICFAAMSCGLYGYPYDEAAEIALTQCLRNHGDIREVHFVLKEQDYYDTWLDEAKRIFKC
ncbi:hypothetical protein SELMODRAFT_113024 [Selaginella moellendorffii]|uniref:Macro domain-containing protein n=1 Tax=Selaginella moellendorffii TaxID=88036 RepID=D8SBP6_SELML|nr:hypothetical protein SELMODRAFT_132899 [Selaginella moellendorffii]EFJ18292.1 hypothetical protein SELMODRAFT_113024 [Selaginella moellendorffii]